MTTDKLETGGPAFPNRKIWNPARAEYEDCQQEPGMTARTYAAIHLGVPQSEHEFINDMIRESRRNELAKAAMQGICAKGVPNRGDVIANITSDAYLLADAMLAEGGKKA